MLKRSPPQPQRQRPALPKHPHSDLLNRWLDLVAGTTHVIKIERGGIEAMLAERDKWDWRDVKTYTLPMLEALSKTLTEYAEAITNTCNSIEE